MTGSQDRAKIAPVAPQKPARSAKTIVAYGVVLVMAIALVAFAAKTLFPTKTHSVTAVAPVPTACHGVLQAVVVSEAAATPARAVVASKANGCVTAHGVYLSSAFVSVRECLVVQYLYRDSKAQVISSQSVPPQYCP